MRYMLLLKATADTESGRMPTDQELTEMGQFNEKLVNAGVMLAGEGLHASADGARRAVHRDERTHRGVLDHPGRLKGRSGRMGQARSADRGSDRGAAGVRGL